MSTASKPKKSKLKKVIAKARAHVAAKAAAAKSEVKPTKDTGRHTLYAYVTRDTKAWLGTLQENQIGKVSKSTMVEKIFHALRTKPEAFKALGL